MGTVLTLGGQAAAVPRPTPMLPSVGSENTRVTVVVGYCTVVLKVCASFSPCDVALVDTWLEHTGGSCIEADATTLDRKLQM